MKRPLLIFAALTLLLGGAGQVRAGFITGEVWINQPGPSGNAQLGFGNPSSGSFLGTPDATFNSGAFNYNSNVTDYKIGPFLNNPTFTNTSAAFNAAGGANADLNNTYFYFTGSITLNAGNNTFVVGHDDGLQLNIDGIGLVVNTPGPTSFTNTPFTVTAPTAGDYNIELSYGETFGPPAQLLWQVNGVTITSSPAPEPGTLTLASMGVVGLFGYGWRNRRKVVA
jgi:hypothetical protein